MGHVSKFCTERLRKIGSKFTNKSTVADEKIETVDQELDYDAKHDRWNGFVESTYACVVKRFEAGDEARRTYLDDQRLNEGGVTDEENTLKVDEAKVDESTQMDFAKVQKRVRTTGGGSTGTVRNLRIREDTAKYLLNLDVNSAYYDPKSRSMREDPLPDANPNEKFYEGDNQYLMSGQALEFKQLNTHMEAAPTQVELLNKNYKVIKEKLKSKTKDTIMEKYGNAASVEDMPMELLLGQSERRQVEYDRAVRVVNGMEGDVPRSKYEEDVYISNHTSVWGYKCCKQTLYRCCWNRGC